MRALSYLALVALPAFAACLAAPVDPAGAPAPTLPSRATFLAPLEMGGVYLLDNPATCAFHNCGASEPSVEVAADGTVYTTGVCCIGRSPPIWVSRDGGATFSYLQGDALRENFGIEGDFAIDDAGNMYFSDISLASAYFSSWDKDGNHRWTVPAGTFLPMVDRPWVRAGAEDVVYFLYNAGTATYHYRSEDGGRTWMPKGSFSGNLGAFGQGPERDHLWVAARGILYESTDGGDSWSAGEKIPKPTEDGNQFQEYEVPVVDEEGNVWIVYDWRNAPTPSNETRIPAEDDRDAAPYHVYAARRDAAGEWHGPFRVSPEGGTHAHPWAAVGATGTLAVAWYGAPAANEGPNSVGANDRWYIHVATTTNGLDESPVFATVLADPEHVLMGPLGRKLLDFVQIDVGPDGGIHLVYAKDPTNSGDEKTYYARTPADPAFAPVVFANGPKDAPAAAGETALPARVASWITGLLR